MRVSEGLYLSRFCCTQLRQLLLCKPLLGKLLLSKKNMPMDKAHSQFHLMSLEPTRPALREAESAQKHTTLYYSNKKNELTVPLDVLGAKEARLLLLQEIKQRVGGAAIDVNLGEQGLWVMGECEIKGSAACLLQKGRRGCTDTHIHIKTGQRHQD